MKIGSDFKVNYLREMTKENYLYLVSYLGTLRTHISYLEVEPISNGGGHTKIWINELEAEFDKVRSAVNEHTPRFTNNNKTLQP